MLSLAIGYVDYRSLRKAGFNAVVIDKDNCLVGCKLQAEELNSDIARARWAVSAFTSGFGPLERPGWDPS